MRKVIFSILLGAFLYLSAGCSLEPLQMVMVSSSTLQKRVDIQQTETDNTSASIKLSQHGESACRVKYHPSYSANHWMVIEGSLGNSKKYPVVLDTGATPALFINDIHILENHLAVSPSENSGNALLGEGKAYLPELSIGNVSLVNWPCYYQGRHAEVQLFGLPISKCDAIIAGLPALRRFKYIAFDSINKEAELSPEKAFKPADLSLWSQYSLVIEEGLADNAYLFVKIPIAGKETLLQLDTGSGNGLAIREELWENMREKINGVKLSKGSDLYPYIGQLDCRKGTAAKLQVGSRIVKNAKISVFPDDSPLVDGCQGLLGMEYFQNTVMVLDFERNLMWVKSEKS